MKIKAHVDYVTTTVTDEDGHVLFEYSVDNLKYEVDVDQLVQDFNKVANLFNASINGTNEDENEPV